MFEAERARLQELLAPWLADAPIEHVGSTAVPGLAAKPIIDIMAPVRGLAESRDAIEALKALDYMYAPYRSRVMHWFCKPSPRKRTREKFVSTRPGSTVMIRSGFPSMSSRSAYVKPRTANFDVT